MGFALFGVQFVLDFSLVDSGVHSSKKLLFWTPSESEFVLFGIKTVDISF